MIELEQIASDAVKRATAGGATDAECTISEGEEFSVNVRMREVENLTQAGSRAAGIRVLIGKCSGSSYTSDLSAKGIESMVAAAIELAGITTEDPFAGLPEEFGQLDTDLRLYDDAIEKMEAEWKIEQARRTEDVALSADPRIQNSEGAAFQSYLGTRVFANSRGFTGSYRTSSCGMSVTPIAKAGSGRRSMEMRLLVFIVAFGEIGLEFGAAELVGKACGGAGAAAVESTENRHATRAGDFRTADGAGAAG